MAGAAPRSAWAIATRTFSWWGSVSLTLLIGRRIWWPSRLSRPAAEPPDGQQPLADYEEPALHR
jgi:hypothetical protein